MICLDQSGIKHHILYTVHTINDHAHKRRPLEHQNMGAEKLHQAMSDVLDYEQAGPLFDQVRVLCVCESTLIQMHVPIHSAGEQFWDATVVSLIRTHKQHKHICVHYIQFVCVCAYTTHRRESSSGMQLW